MNKTYELAIIGAGPAGLSCAIEAKKAGIETLLIDKGNVVDAIIRFPVNMTFFSTSDVLSLADIPFNSQQIRPTRTEAIQYYQSLIKYFDINIKTDSKVINISKADKKFTIHTSGTRKDTLIAAENVVLATGYYDNPNRLNIPGEDLAHVSHFYTEPYSYFRKKVIVVGGKNSAVEAALDLYRHGAEVAIIHRRSKIGESVKYWILPDIENRINEGSISAFFDSNLTQIRLNSVTVKTNGTTETLNADAVFLLTGYHPDVSLLERCGIIYDPVSQEPKVNKTTLETNVKGLYIAGSLLAGKNANRIFIENSRIHGARIVNALKRHLSRG